MTTTDDLIARAQAVLDAAEKMTPGPWKSRGVMIDPAIACIPHRPSMYTLGRTDESTPADDARADADATGIATLRNDAPAVIRDLLARLADQARGLTVGAPPRRPADPTMPDDIRAQIEAARRRVLALRRSPRSPRTRAAEAAARAASSAEAAVSAWIWNGGEESAP